MGSIVQSCSGEFLLSVQQQTGLCICWLTSIQKILLVTDATQLHNLKQDKKVR